MMASLILQLFVTFFLIGMFTFGGGYAVIGMIQSEVVIAKGWVSNAVFTDIVAISQVTPGPVGLNCSTYVGYEVLSEAGASEFVCCLGSLVSSISVILPSFIIMLSIVKFYSKFHETPLFRGVLSGLKPAVAGLIAASAVVLMFSFDSGVGIVAENFPDYKSWILFALAFVAYFFFKQDPVKILAFGAVMGLFLY